MSDLATLLAELRTVHYRETSTMEAFYEAGVEHVVTDELEQMMSARDYCGGCGPGSRWPCQTTILMERYT